MNANDIREHARRHDNLAALYRTQGPQAAEVAKFHEKTSAELRIFANVLEAAQELQATKRMKDEIESAKYPRPPPPPGRVSEYKKRRKLAWIRNDLAIAQVEELWA